MFCSSNDSPCFTAEDRILVTGASSGIGEAIALRLNKLGATVIANGRARERLDSLLTKAANPRALHIEPLDLTAEMSALPFWVRSLKEKYGKLRAFVHSAGLGLTAPLREYDLEEARELFDIHFHAPMLLAKGFTDRRNNTGVGASIVFIASIRAVHPLPGTVVYASAKGAVITATGSLSKELSGQRIRVNCITPALVATAMGNGFADFLGDPGFIAEGQEYPLGIGQPKDIAFMTSFLISDQAAWITGQNIVMDGGRY